MMMTMNSNTEQMINGNEMFSPVFVNDVPQFMSMYIPNIDHNITKTELRNVIENVYSMGDVDRIDFVAHGSTSARRMGFVHMKQWSPVFCQNLPPCGFRNMMEMNETVAIRWVNTDSITGDTTLYEVDLLVNQRPAPKTDLTIDQIADSTSLLNEKVSDVTTKTQINIETMGVIHDSMEMMNDMINGVGEQINNLHMDTYSMMDDITQQKIVIENQETKINRLITKNDEQSQIIDRMAMLIETQQKQMEALSKKLDDLERKVVVESEIQSKSSTQFNDRITKISTHFNNRIKSIEVLLASIKNVFFG
jgi:hypothetical protein